MHFPTSRQRIRQGLQAYVDHYEIDYPLWFIGVLANAFKSGQTRASAFGGPSTTTAQGSLVEAVLRATADTPLADLLASAYDADLRNAAGHNDFEIVEEGDDVTVRAANGTLSWSTDELYNKVFSTTQFLDAVHTVASYITVMERTDSLDAFKDAGTVSVGYAHFGVERAPLVVLFQLWCFHQLDPAGAWIDDAGLTIQTSETQTEEIARFTSNAWSKGEPLTTSEFGDALAQREWATVIRIPVAPDLGLGLPHFTRPDGARYEIVGQLDEHVIPYLGAERYQGTWPE